MNASLAISINEPGHAGEARRTVAKWGQEEGWADEIAGRVALIVTELAGNLTLHTNGGTLLLRMLSKNGAKGVEVLSLDRGPGVNNFNECLRDGYSTAGTSGIGLGAVKRASQVFAVHSQPADRHGAAQPSLGKGHSAWRAVDLRRCECRRPAGSSVRGLVERTPFSRGKHSGDSGRWPRTRRIRRRSRAPGRGDFRQTLRPLAGSICSPSWTDAFARPVVPPWRLRRSTSRRRWSPSRASAILPRPS